VVDKAVAVASMGAKRTESERNSLTIVVQKGKSVKSIKLPTVRDHLNGAVSGQLADDHLEIFVHPEMGDGEGAFVNIGRYL